MIKDGDLAPDFTAPDQNGREVSLQDFRGKNIVLYFYPKDETSGCVKEACSFRDDSRMFEGIGAEVVGVSVDGVESHKRFYDKYGLNFTLVSDKKKEITKKYGVLKFTGSAKRTTFLIGKDGKVKYIFNDVKPDGHSKEVLDRLKEM
ncbi:MAG: peroxiredoxin [Candidatus Aenigmarchaeota archaeon]|nr:peroxiredoxin [Candidatus Aenigmarchaeota archaeon]